MNKNNKTIPQKLEEKIDFAMRNYHQAYTRQGKDYWLCKADALAKELLLIQDMRYK